MSTLENLTTPQLLAICAGLGLKRRKRSTALKALKRVAPGQLDQHMPGVVFECDRRVTIIYNKRYDLAPNVPHFLPVHVAEYFKRHMEAAGATCRVRLS